MQVELYKNKPFQQFEKIKNQYREKLKSPTNSNEQITDSFKKCKLEKDNRALMAIFSLAGAILPVLAINIAQGKGKNLQNAFKNTMASKKDKFKAIYNMFEMKNYTDLLASTTGAITGGIIGGILGDKNPENKKEKYKEGVFEFLNNMIPTTFVALGEHISKKTGKFKSAPARALLIISSVAGGMFIANKSSNKINEKTFDKKEKEKSKRNFKITDCFVHTDDILGLLVLARIPLAKVIHADKILPLLYARSGYEVATTKKNKN